MCVAWAARGRRSAARVECCRRSPLVLGCFATLCDATASVRPVDWSDSSSRFELPPQIHQVSILSPLDRQCSEAVAPDGGVSNEWSTSAGGNAQRGVHPDG